jgi:hypothetical protein
MKYTIKSAFITNVTAEIEADNYDHAYRLASLIANKTKDDSVSLRYETTGTEDIKIKDITLSDANFTAEQLAFTEAYLSNVASADRDTVKKFLLAKDHDTFCEEHGDEYYTGLADARGVWYDAKIFFAKEMMNKFNTGEKSE